MKALDHGRQIVEARSNRRARRQFRRWEETLPQRWVDVVNLAHAYTRTEKEAVGFVRVVRPVVKFVDEPVPGLVGRYRVTTAGTQTSAELAAKAKHLAEGLGVHAVRIIPGKVRRREGAPPPKDITHTMLVLVSDPLPAEDVWRWDEWVAFRDDPVLDGPNISTISWGITELHRPLELPISGFHALIGGTTRSGKSYTMAAQELALAVWQPMWATAPVRVICLSIGDPKPEIAAAFEPRCTIAAMTVPHIEAMLCAHRDVITARQRRKAGMGELRDPTEETPLLRIVLDELATYTRNAFDVPGAPCTEQYKTMAQVQARRLEVLVDLAERSAGSGGSLSIGTQYPTVDVVPEKVRGNCDLKILHRVTGRQMPAVVLGDGLDGFTFEDVRDAAQGEVFIRRSVARGGPGAELERGQVSRARSLFVHESELPGLVRRSTVFKPTASSSRDVAGLLERYGYWCRYFGVEPGSHEVPGMSSDEAA